MSPEEREAPTNPDNERPDPALAAFERLDSKVDELLAISVKTLNAVLAHEPRIKALEEDNEAIWAELVLIKRALKKHEIHLVE